LEKTLDGFLKNLLSINLSWDGVIYSYFRKLKRQKLLCTQHMLLCKWIWSGYRMTIVWTNKGLGFWIFVVVYFWQRRQIRVWMFAFLVHPKW
jgi:hypothetical protein